MDLTGEHQFKVFDDEFNAKIYADYLKQHGGFKVFIWEL